MTTTQGTEATETLTINGREFAVTRHPSRPDQYVLTGKRGAIYGTMRHYKHPQVMFLINGRTMSRPTVSRDTVWVTDRNGRLELVRSWCTDPKTDDLMIR